MHIPDAYLSPGTELAAFIVMTPIWAMAIKRTTRDLTSRQTPLLSVGAAFCFAIQMFNVPALGGTTAHALGATLLAILVGPWAAVIGMTLTLVIQAFLFGDGGVLSLGANCFDMAFVASTAGYGVYRWVGGNGEAGSSRRLIGAACGAYAGTVLASLSAGLLLGIQPLVAHDSLGHALYCPFGLNVSVPAMVITHLLVAAPVEAMITVSALGYLRHSFPELLAAQASAVVSSRRLSRQLGWVLVLTPLGLLAGGSAWGEWDASELQQKVGYVPAGMAQTHSSIHALLPDYGFIGMSGKAWEVIGYLVSAAAGSLLVALFTRSVLRRQKSVSLPAGVGQGMESVLPEWLCEQSEVVLPNTAKIKAPWLERTVMRMHSVVTQTIATEDVARSPGLLQGVHPTAKLVGFLAALIVTAFSRNLACLSAISGLSLALAAASNVPLRPFLSRVVGSTAFFGLVLALPLSLQTVTPGPLAAQILGVPLSLTGVHAAEVLLLRLATGISLAMVWNLTTQWRHLLRSLGALGVPQTILTMATLSYRYIFVMLETLGDMVEARTSRQVGGCDKREARTYAGAGTAVLFAKSLALTEEMHLAMQSRGFQLAPRGVKSAGPISVDSINTMTGTAILSSFDSKGALDAV